MRKTARRRSTGTRFPGSATARTRIDTIPAKTPPRAFRRRKLLETGVHATVEDIAAAEKIDTSYVSRILRVTLLALDIVEIILDGRQPAVLTMAMLMKPFPVEWEGQREVFQRQDVERQHPIPLPSPR